MDPKKAAAEWFRTTVFKKEAIRPRPAQAPQPVPPIIRAARSLENGPYQTWQSRESVFMKQGKLLASYEDEDDHDHSTDIPHYYPTYQSLTNRELRGYFSWRTKLRRGDVRKTSLSFAFLYIYELINQIGVTDPMDGYRKLENFRDAYGQIDARILPYLDRWMKDYVVYYGLDAALLSEGPQAALGQYIAVLEHIQEQEPAKLVEAVNRLSRGYLDRSRFYKANPEDMDAVIVRVLRKMSDHYAARCKKTLTEQYFGVCSWSQARPFDGAVFCDPLKRRNYEYSIDGQCVCRCRDGVWSAWTRSRPSGPGNTLGALLKTIDSVMRQAYGDSHPVNIKVETKWVLRLIQEEVQKLLAEKRTAEEKKITIDYGQLTQIRRDAAVTREKLIVEEETDPVEEPAPPEQEPKQSPLAPGEAAGDSPLSPVEYRLLQCLLYGGSLDWVQGSGHLLSVLVDGINEKLYDAFQDSVLDDTPCLFEDYIDDLKEMIHP